MSRGRVAKIIGRVLLVPFLVIIALLMLAVPLGDSIAPMKAIERYQKDPTNGNKRAIDTVYSSIRRTTFYSELVLGSVLAGGIYAFIVLKPRHI
jgi:hypothetical protein